jgi:hypothetical protein
VTSYSLVDGFKLFGGKYCFHISPKKEENYLAETSHTYHKSGIIIRKNVSTNMWKCVYKLQGHYFIWQITSHFHRCRVTADSGAPVAVSIFFRRVGVYAFGFGCRSRLPRGLRRRSSVARLLRSWVRIPRGAWMFVCCDCCVFSGRGLCDGLITRPEESYQLWRVVVFDQKTSKTRRLKPATGLWKIKPQWVVTPGKQTTNKQFVFCI